jgi:23S rRNA (uracil1939-C5)-methyltransferase
MGNSNLSPRDASPGATRGGRSTSEGDVDTRGGRAPREGEEEVGVVAALTHAGEGIVRGGKTAFVVGALPTERIRFRRTKRHKQHDDARLIEVIEPAADRAQPRCAHFGVCGGCALQHLAPESQLAAKQLELRDNLERLARVMPDEWLEPLRGPVWNYRRRARLGAKYVTKKGRVVVGFRERLSPYVAALDRCEVLAAPADALITPLSEMLTTLSIRERLPQIEVAVADHAVALVLRVLSPPSESDLATLRTFEHSHAVRLYLQPAGLDSIHRLLPAAEPPLTYALPQFNLTLEFTPTDFIQINGPINQSLVTRALDLLAPDPESAVLDLYCGLGNFTLPLARRAARVAGVEGDPALVERARNNARRNGIDNVEFHVADLAEPRPAAAVSAPAWATSAFPYVLIDPPRAGAREMLPTVARLATKRVLYISCHPGSLARDVGMLVHDHGFRLRAAGVLDMFPHTTHVESLAVLEPGPARS